MVLAMFIDVFYEEEVLRTATRLGIMAHDSSYVVLAQKRGLTLVTGDNELRSRAQGLVRCASVDELSSTTRS